MTALSNAGSPLPIGAAARTLVAPEALEPVWRPKVRLVGLRARARALLADPAASLFAAGVGGVAGGFALGAPFVTVSAAVAAFLAMAAMMGVESAYGYELPVRPSQAGLKAAHRAGPTEVVLPEELSPGARLVLTRARACVAKVTGLAQYAADAPQTLTSGLFGLACDLRLLDRLEDEAHRAALFDDDGSLSPEALALLDAADGTADGATVRRLVGHRARVNTTIGLYEQVAHDVDLYVATLAAERADAVMVTETAAGLRSRLEALRELLPPGQF